MKKILVVLCCLMLVSCTKASDIGALKDQHALELDEKDNEIVSLKENHKNEVKAFEDARDVLIGERDELKSSESELLKLYDQQVVAYKHFNHVFETAHKVIEDLMFESNIYSPENNYSEYRLDDLLYSYYDDDLDITIYSMNYSFKSLTPEDIIYAGAMHLMEDGWIVPTYPNSHYLIFREDSYLGHFFINDATPESPLFKEELKQFLVNDSIKQVRLDFIDGDQLYSFDMNTNIAFELYPYGDDFYSISGVYEGFISGIFKSNFDIHTQLPNHASIILEESFETDLGSVELITLDADLGTGDNYKGTYKTYYAYLKVTDQEGYLLNYTMYDELLSTKLEFIAMLKSIRRRELEPCEKVALKNIVVSSNEGIDIVLKEGYFTNDEEFWTATGPKWVGQFEAHVKKGEEVIITPLNPLWFMEDLFFYAPEFKLDLNDYNKDGLLDFALSQYAAVNIDFYMLFTILEDGTVIRTPFDVDDILGRTTRDNNPHLTVENNQIVSTWYDNTAVVYHKDYYKWDGEKYLHIKREELE